MLQRASDPGGYQVVSATHGEEGIAKVEKYRPDLIILDLAIPGLSGRSLLWELKKIAKDTPVLIISGRVGMQDDPEIQISLKFIVFSPNPSTLWSWQRQSATS